MKGLVYKEWKQNHMFILSMILCAIAPFAIVQLLEGERSAIVCIIGLIIGFLAAGALQMMVLNGDDRKLWSYWVSSTADGYRGFLRNKYYSRHYARNFNGQTKQRTEADRIQQTAPSLVL